MNPLRIRLSGQVTLAVPPRLDSITTYVLLEQETWFEKELGFLRRWLKPDMTVIDIGANLGVYALVIARLVGDRGRVIAYEPGSEARALLEQSRAINGAGNLEIIELALSDTERAGTLVKGASSELNALGEGVGEYIHITTLDIEKARRGWAPPDFVKIDAEGEEERILAGGREFFSQYAPLVMFEIKAGDITNENLRDAFSKMGYQLFRLLIGEPILVPLAPGEALDQYELNLFAAKRERVDLLRGEDLLVDRESEWSPDSASIAEGGSLLCRQAFAPAFREALNNSSRIDPDYARALAAFAAWRSTDNTAATRYAALSFARRTLIDLCRRAPSTSRVSTLARVTWEGGWRGESVAALQQLVAHIQRNQFWPVEPCWPASPRFDSTMPANPALWFATAVTEQLERARSHSTLFSGPSPWLDWLCGQPGASKEMHRRKALLAARAGQMPKVPVLLREDAPDHLNASLWRSGLVPGTSVTA